MSIKFARIDDRFVHGQVATTWIKQFSIEQVIIVNDELAKDQVQSSVLQLTAPAGVKIIIFEVDKFIEVYNHNPIKRPTMLLYKNPIDALRTIEGGVTFPYLNLGGMKFTPGKEQVTKSVSLDERDKEALKKIMERGIMIEIQMVPNDKKINLNEIIK